jgi:predicted metal-dependent hydrolase
MTAPGSHLRRDAHDDGDAGDEVRYAVRRSDRARRVRVTVDAVRGVEVVLPRRAPARAADEAVQELGPWIRRRLAELNAARSVVAARGDTVPYLGTTLRLVPQPGRTRVHRRGEVLLVPAGDEQEPALERWYRRAARGEIAPRLDWACEQAGLSYKRLTIRAQRTRWASCSRSGAMSFNWRLLLAPPEVLDYVVWHEVCHLQVLDHSPTFWALLARWCPDYRARSAWLRRHGQTLVL